MMNSSRSSLSSQRAALEAASKEDDSPSQSSSPQNTNRGKLDQKHGDDDSKPKMEMDDMGDVKVKTEAFDEHEMGKWEPSGDMKMEMDDMKMEIKNEIKSESGDAKLEKCDSDGQQLDMNTNVIGRDNWNEMKDMKQEKKMSAMDDIKKSSRDDPMSPSSSDSQAVVKSELKIEPVANNTMDKKKKCSKFRNMFHPLFVYKSLSSFISLQA